MLGVVIPLIFSSVAALAAEETRPGRTLYVPSLNVSLSSNFAKDQGGDDRTLATGSLVRSSLEVTIRLQNISDLQQSGTFTLDQITTAFRHSTGLGAIRGRRWLVIRSGSRCIERQRGFGEGEEIPEMSIPFNLPAMGRIDISVQLAGQAKFGPTNYADGTARWFQLRLNADPQIKVNQDRGALLATLTTNNGRDTRNCAGIETPGSEGYVTERGGMDSTLLLNGGRPF